MMQIELPPRSRIEYKYVILEEQVRLIIADVLAALQTAVAQACMCHRTGPNKRV